MCTNLQSPKVQGPRLRAAIEELPLESKNKLNRSNLQNATAGEVAAAISDRCLNDLTYLFRVIESSTSSYRDGYDDKLTVGIYVLCDEIKNEINTIGNLAHAIWMDEREVRL